jgi:C1A family cysteine protease
MIDAAKHSRFRDHNTMGTWENLMNRIAAIVVLCLVLSFSFFSSAKSEDNVVHGMGAIAPTPDQIKSFPKAPKDTRRGALPAHADSSAYMPPIGDQGGAGSCVAWSTGYALRAFYLAKNNKFDVSKPENVPSPAYIFNHGAAIEHSSAPCSERGMLISTALEILRAGVLSLAEMPYNDKVCGPAPDIEMQSRAKEFRIDGWQFVDPESFDIIKGALADGNAVVFGIKIAQTFNDFKGEGVYARSPKDKLMGGHAMVLIGYDDERKAFHLQNSWGRDWADHGRAWLSYDTFKSDATDAYIVRASGGR